MDEWLNECWMWLDFTREPLLCFQNKIETHDKERRCDCSSPTVSTASALEGHR